jgi:hypothetical protein
MLFGVWHDGSSRVSGGYHDSSSPDAWYSSPVASAVAASSRRVAVPAGSIRGRRLNDKLYAIRSVVPNITKVNRSSCIYMRACVDCEMCKLGKTQMDKASIVKDAIEYVRQLQEQERQLLAEMSILESAAPATHGQLLATAERGAQAVDGVGRRAELFEQRRRSAHGDRQQRGRTVHLLERDGDRGLIVGRNGRLEIGDRSVVDVELTNIRLDRGGAR